MSARIVAVRILSRILKSQETLTQVLQHKSLADSFRSLPKADKSFCYNLVMISLRHYDTLSQFMKGLPDKKMRFKRYDKVPLVLLTGLAQIIFLDTPLYAVQAESQKLLKRPEDGAFKKFIHAMLQRGHERQEELGSRELSDWQIGWQEFYGEIQAEEIWQAIYEKPPLDLHFSDEKSCQEFIAKLSKEEILHQQDKHVRIAGGDIVEKLPFYDKGTWWIQDIAATLPVQILLEGQDRGRRVLDLCAAPGGKTIQLIKSGAEVVSVEKSLSRIKLLQENLKRMNCKCEIIAKDILEYRPQEKFSHILLDAPCSASGTMRHNPELPLIKRREESASVAEMQLHLLNYAYEHLLADGGRMVYSVCSMEPCEGEEVIGKFKDNNSSAKIVSLANVPDFCRISPDGYGRTYPSDWQDKGRMDGFFIACISKESL